MNRFDLALRRFESFELGQAARLSPAQIDVLGNWFRTDFAAVAASLVERADFRTHARWTTQNLGKCSSSPARQLLERIESALVETGRRLLSIATAPDTRARASRRNTAPRVHDDHLRGLTIVGQKLWLDLVSPSDFFWPSVGLNLQRHVSNSDREQVPPDLDPRFCEDLRTPGDFVAGCALRRARHWGELLERSLAELRHQVGDIAEHDAALSEAMATWADPWFELRGMCLESSEARLRGSIIAIIQLTSAWSPMADFRWLRLPMTDRLMAYELRRRLDQGDRSIADMAFSSLLAVAALYRSEPDFDLTIQEAAESHLLCVIDAGERREVYWQGQLLSTDWQQHNRAWTLLYRLVQHRFGVDERTKPGGSKDARAELKRYLPKALYDRMSVKNGVHHLDIPRDQLFVARVEQHDTLRVLS